MLCPALQAASWGLWPGPSPGSGSLTCRLAGGPDSIPQRGSFSLSPSKNGFGLFPTCPLRGGLGPYCPQNLLSPQYITWHLDGVLSGSDH